MAMSGMETWIMSAFHNGGSGGVTTSSLRFGASSVEAQAVIHSLTVFEFTDDGKICHLDVYLQQTR